MQIDGFIDKDEFKKQIDDWIQVFRKTKPAPRTNGRLIPGDAEREAEAIRTKEEIPLFKSVVDDLLHIAKKTAVPFESHWTIPPNPLLLIAMGSCNKLAAIGRIFHEGIH